MTSPRALHRGESSPPNPTQSPPGGRSGVAPLDPTLQTPSVGRGGVAHTACSPAIRGGADVGTRLISPPVNQRSPPALPAPLLSPPLTQLHQADPRRNPLPGPGLPVEDPAAGDETTAVFTRILATLRLTFARPYTTAAAQAPSNDAPTLSARSPSSESR